MAQVFRFTQSHAKDAKERAVILDEIRRLALACDVPWETITLFACGKDKTWDDMPLDFLYGPMNILRAELAKKESEAAKAAVPPRRAKVIAFSGQGASVPGRVPVPRPAHAPQPDAESNGKRAAEKARYIQRVKMLQRDCEKALPRFDDTTYRDILSEQFNVYSCTALEAPQLRALLMYMKGLLRDAKGGAVQCSFDAPALLYHDPAGLGRERLMRRILGALKEKGAREGKYVPWNYALGILKRASGGVAATWEDALPVNLKAIIAALHYDAKRKGRRTR